MLRASAFVCIAALRTRDFIFPSLVFVDCAPQASSFGPRPPDAENDTEEEGEQEAVEANDLLDDVDGCVSTGDNLARQSEEGGGRNRTGVFRPWSQS